MHSEQLFSRRARFPRILFPVKQLTCAALAWTCGMGLPLVSAGDKTIAPAVWPEFRGPTRDGHAPANTANLPVSWSATENVAWKTELPGRAWSSPIIAGDRIYMTNAVGQRDSTDLKDTYSLRVLAIHAADGKVLWDREMFHEPNPHSHGMHSKNSYASCTPVYEDGRIYVHFGHFGTACVDESGEILWKTTELSYKPVHGNGGCPVIVGANLIFMADAGEAPFIAALDKATGKVAWKQARISDAQKTFSFCTPQVIEVNGSTQVICVGSNVVSALRPEDGTEIWRARFSGFSVVPRPVYAHGLLFVSTGYDKPSFMAIRADGQGDVTDTHVVWTMQKGSPLTPSPLVIGDELYLVADNGMVSCLDARSGRLHWQERVSRQTSASPIYADGKIYIQDELGTGYVLKPGLQLEILSKNELDDRSLATPAVYGNQFIIRTQNALWCIGRKDG